MIDPRERCPFCFRETCGCIDLLRYHFDGVAACFDNYGPPQTLLKRVQTGKRSYLAKILASFILVQWERMGWPVPDYIVPVPTKPFHTPFNIKEITYYVAHMLHLPKRSILKRSLLKDRGLFKTRGNLENKTLLLIQGTLSPVETIDEMGKALLEKTPKAIYLHAFLDNS